ncbi:thiamine-phosphate kinase [bacterium]|nr:thiamine-phosphate kinase [bacterium]
MRLNEREMVSLIRRKLGSVSSLGTTIIGPGDDAAAIDIGSGMALVLSTDTIVENVHFKSDWVSAYLLGYKSFLAAVSDIYAMGARPNTSLCSLGLPTSRTTRAFIDELFDGLVKAGAELGVETVGGNISRSRELFISTSVTGFANADTIAQRSGAKVGDSIYVTGRLGGAAVATHCLLNGRFCESDIKDAHHVLFARCASEEMGLEHPIATRLLKELFMPTLRAQESLALSEQNFCTSMIDISDGIGSDLQAICDESKVGASIDVTALPLFEGAEVLEMPGESGLLNPLIQGGEDFELLFTVNRGDESRLRDFFHKKGFCEITRIGRITGAVEGMRFVDASGSGVSGIDGFDHFAEIGEDLGV